MGDVVNNDGPYQADAAERLQRGDLRNVLRMRCGGCRYEWIAPARGLCPKCRSENNDLLEQKEIAGVRRV